MRKRLLSTLVLSSLLGVTALATAGGSAGGTASALPKIPKIPNIPKVKVIKYPVTIDVAGYVDFVWNYDAREKCVAAYAKTVTEETSFELGRPQETALTSVGGVLGTIPVTAGQAKHRASVGGYQVSKTCPQPPQQPVGPKGPEPTCRSGGGKLQAWLAPRPLAKEPEDGLEALTPLGRGVNLIISRIGGNGQKTSCFEKRPEITTVGADPWGYSIETLPYSHSGMVLPLDGTGADFWELKAGETVRRSIPISGGCGGAKASAIPSTIKSCRISGRVIVHVKRLR